MRRFRSEQEIRVQVDDGVGAAGAIYTDRNSGSRSLAQIGVHAQRDLHICFIRQKYLPHRHRLQGLLRNLP